MARLFGKEVPRASLLEAVGDMSQVCGIQSFAFDQGTAKGVRALEFRNGGGLRFVVLPDRGMDIFSAEYRGIPLNWLSGTGPVAPQYYSPRGWDWLRGFYGGMLVTCGLSNVGEACRDRGAYLAEEEFGAHGRIANLPAANVTRRCSWEGERYVLSAEGEVLEAAGQGEKLRLTRAISTEMGAAEIEIRDEVANESYYRVPHMFLYHINAGFPLLDAGARIYTRAAGVEGLDPASRKQAASVGEIHRPEGGSPEQVYLLDMEPDREGLCHAVLANPSLDAGAGLGIYLRYRKEELPYFTLWKRLSRREYVVGFEPGNCTVQGRNSQRERGDLRHLEPQETARYGFTLGVLSSAGEVERFVESHALRPL